MGGDERTEPNLKHFTWDSRLHRQKRHCLNFINVNAVGPLAFLYIFYVYIAGFPELVSTLMKKSLSCGVNSADEYRPKVEFVQ